MFPWHRSKGDITSLGLLGRCQVFFVLSDDVVGLKINTALTWDVKGNDAGFISTCSNQRNFSVLTTENVKPNQ